jgi:hypothetical protein
VLAGHGDRRFAAKCALLERMLVLRGCARIRVRGGSMLPTLWPGESVLVVPTGDAVLRPGLVVLIAHDRRFVVHRVVTRITAAGVPTMLVTRGDASREVDAPVPVAEVLGLVVAVHRFGRDRALGQPLPGRGGLAWALAIGRRTWLSLLAARAAASLR